MRVHESELYHDPCRGPLHKYIYQAFLYPAFRHDGLHLAGDVIEVRHRRSGRVEVDGALYN